VIAPGGTIIPFDRQIVERHGIAIARAERLGEKHGSILRWSIA
jgi:hypothetical protein